MVAQYSPESKNGIDKEKSEVCEPPRQNIPNSAYQQRRKRNLRLVEAEY